jgi:hypothetical protein
MRKVVLLVIVVLSIAGCARPQYWVKGLTLPPGSVEKSRSETKMESSESKPKLGEQPDGTLLVYFDNTSSWDEITAHVGGELKKEGFVEAANQVADIGSSLAGKVGGSGLAGKLGIGDKLKDAAKGFLDTTRIYRKDEYTVTLSNMKSIMESKVYSQLKKSRKDAGGEPKGQYMLSVTKRKGADADGPGGVQLPAGK